MKVVPASYQILQDHEDKVSQIASKARICYKSEDKATEDEKPFLKRIWNHEPCFEMAVFHLSVVGGTKEGFDALRGSKYLITDNYSVAHMFVTGSVRAFREFIIANPGDMAESLLSYFLEHESFFFEDITSNPIQEIPSDVQAFYPSKLSLEMFKRHHHQAVHIITNRAVTHEIVRHRPVAYLQESQRYCRYDQEKFGNEVTFIEPSAFNFNADQHLLWSESCADSEYMYFKLLNSGASPQAARTVLPNSCKTEIIVYCSLREWEHIFNRRTSPAAEPSMREIMIPLHKDFQVIYPEAFDNCLVSIG